MFQSAPRDFSRGDNRHHTLGPHGQRFNPRPVISHGAIPHYINLRSFAKSFNPRPVISHGAIGHGDDLQVVYDVSIRAP